MGEESQKLLEAKESVLKSFKSKIIFGILGLIFTALAGVYIYLRLNAPSPTPIPIEPKKLINAQEKIIRVSAGDLSQDIEKAFEEKIPESEIRVFLLSENKNNLDYFLPEEEFFMKTGLRPHLRLNQSITEYNLGGIGHAGGEKNSPFLLFEISSFENARAGALSWERSMYTELRVIFPELDRASYREFRDEVIKNQDARVFESGQGKIFYAFFNKKIMIITGNRKTLEDILSRYEIFPPN